MRLKKLEIDGFKSYAKPVVITDFDPSFNAITGYNGTGKSNVLDAICFVLGISTLKQVRAARWTDLIYKQAQAGIVKATVTATFEHSDPKHKIPGFDLGKDIIVRRQVISCGRVAYTINGSNATQTRVHEMFRAIGMNVNNPHFLIMQGKIGKVLNMNAKEILAMVEEAVGVRIYESKKTVCLRTIEKKEEKMVEISKILDDDILPKMERLRSERESFLTFERLKVEVAKLRKKIVVYEFISTEQGIQRYKDEAQAKRVTIGEIDDDVNDSKRKMKELEDEITAMTKEKDGEMDKERAVIQTALGSLQKTQMEKEAGVADFKSEIQTTKQAVVSLEKSKKTSKKDLEKKENQRDVIEKDAGEQVRLMNEAEEDLRKAQDMRTALQKNKVIDDEGNEANLNDVLIRYNGKISTINTEIAKNKADINDFIQRIASRKKDIASRGDGGMSDLNMRKQEYLKSQDLLRAQLDRLNFDETAEISLQRKIQEAKVSLSQVSSRNRQFSDRYANLFTTYKEFPPQVPKHEINGFFFTLFSVRDPKFYQAVETMIGYALSYIIVDTARCGKEMLANKVLNQRRTIIPLDDIQGRWCAPDVFKRAQDMCKKPVYHPKDILITDQKYDIALRNFIQSTLICTDRDDAALVTDKLRVKTVTLIGEEFRPGGVTAGGINKGRETLMEDIEAFNQADKALRERQKIMDELTLEHQELQKQSVNYNRLKAELNDVVDFLRQIEDQLKQDMLNVWKEDLKTYETRKIELEDQIKQYEIELPEVKKKKEELEQQRNKKDFFEVEIKKAEQLEKDAKTRLKKYNNAQEKRQQLEKIKNDIDQLNEDIVQTDKDIEEKNRQIEELKIRLEEAESEVQTAKEAVEEQKQILAVHDSKVNEQEGLIKQKLADKATINKQMLELKSNKETLEKAVEADEQKSKECKAKVHELIKKCPWMENDRKHFNVPGTEYDFSEFNYEENKAKLTEKDEQFKEASENINPQAGETLDQNDEQVKDLQEKREQLRLDKAKLLETIKLLDEKKKNEMKNAFFTVNQTFGTIFQTLLNDAQAKLVPAGNGTPENLEEGLEFRVGFNNMWKESLGELSGGQKSLVALSLILSLLKFKPAPLYILDEVDAALDISHTSNIGVLIKKQFKEAQFLIVSLKPGMFKNANAIFRTKMQDGVSAVLRVQDDFEEDMENDPHSKK